MIAATVTVEIISTTTETEATAARSQPHQAAQAALQRTAPRRQVVSLHPHQPAITGRRRILKHRGRAQSRPRALFRSVRLGGRGQPHHHGAATRVPDPLLHRWILRKAAPAPACSTRSAAAPAPCTREIDFPGYTELVREATDFLFGPQPPGEAGSSPAEDGEGVRRGSNSRPRRSIRDRLAALSAIQSQQGINPRTVEEADVVRHPPGGAAIPASRCSSSRTGTELGQPGVIFRARRNPSRRRRCWRPSWPSSTTTRPPPKLILLSHEIEECGAAGRGAGR